MAHNFTSGVFLATPAWHGLGTVIRQPISAKKAIKMAGLNWQIVKQPICRVGEKSYKPLSDHVAIVREDTDEVFSVRHKSYQVFQNWEAFAWLDEFIQSGDLIIDAAICLSEGRRIAITCKINTPPAEIVKDDLIECYFAFKNDHTGSGSLGFLLTPVRIVCQNTLSMAVGKDDFEGDVRLDSKNFRIRNIGNIQEKVSEAKDLIDFQKRCFNDGMKVYKAMAKYNLPRYKFEEYLQEVFSVQFKAKQKHCLENNLPEPSIYDLQVVKNVMEHYYKTCEQMPAIEGTLYSAVQAVSGAITHSKHHQAVQSQLFGRGKSIMEKSLRQAINVMKI